MYESGLKASYNAALGNVPILMSRTYTDNRGDIHDRQRDFVVRARLQRANGRSDNSVIWIASTAGAIAGSLDTMNAWLDAITADPAPLSIDKVVKHKPADAVDTCWDAAGNKIVEPASFDAANKCNAIYPVHSEPRLVAGAPLTNDVMKCQLKPIDFADYKATFTDAQKARAEERVRQRRLRFLQARRGTSPNQGNVPEILRGPGGRARSGWPTARTSAPERSRSSSWARTAVCQGTKITDNISLRMMRQASRRPSRSPPREAAVVTKAVMRAAERLGLPNRVLAGVLGVSEATVSRMGAGTYLLDAGSKPFELAVLFLRLFRSLDAIVGGDTAVARAWLQQREHRARRDADRADRIGRRPGERRCLPGRPPRSRLTRAACRAAAGASSKAQHVVSTMALVDTLEEQALLERIDRQKQAGRCPPSAGTCTICC